MTFNKLINLFVISVVVLTSVASCFYPKVSLLSEMPYLIPIDAIQRFNIENAMKRHASLHTLLLTLFSLRSISRWNYHVAERNGHRNTDDDYPPFQILTSQKFEIEQLKRILSWISLAPVSEKYKFIANYCASVISLGGYMKRERMKPLIETMHRD